MHTSTTHEPTEPALNALAAALDRLHASEPVYTTAWVLGELLSATQAGRKLCIYDTKGGYYLGDWYFDQTRLRHPLPISFVLPSGQRVRLEACPSFNSVIYRVTPINQ